MSGSPTKTASVTVAENGQGRYAHTADDGRHQWPVDEPVETGGGDTGPMPYEILLSALGACTSITVRMYAERKEWPLTRISVRLTHRKEKAESLGVPPTTPMGTVDVIERHIALEGDLTDEQRQRMIEIANKCPVHRTLSLGAGAVVNTFDESGAAT
jgi:putative redox protein